MNETLLVPAVRVFRFDGVAHMSSGVGFTDPLAQRIVSADWNVVEGFRLPPSRSAHRGARRGFGGMTELRREPAVRFGSDVGIPIVVRAFRELGWRVREYC